MKETVCLGLAQRAVLSQAHRTQKEVKALHTGQCRGPAVVTDGETEVSHTLHHRVIWILLSGSSALSRSIHSS